MLFAGKENEAAGLAGGRLMGKPVFQQGTQPANLQGIWNQDLEPGIGGRTEIVHGCRRIL